MKQKFYTLEESLTEKGAASPQPERKRHARASPRVPASSSSSEEVRNTTSQRFYSDGHSAPKDFMEQPVPVTASAAQYESERQAASSMDTPSAKDAPETNQTTNRLNHWVYSANAPRKGEAQFDADPAGEPSVTDDVETLFLTEESANTTSDVIGAKNVETRSTDKKRQSGKKQGKDIPAEGTPTENWRKPRSSQAQKGEKGQKPQQSKSHLILHTAEDAAHQRVREDEEDNLGLQAAHETEQGAETVWQHGGHAAESWKHHLDKARQSKAAPTVETASANKTAFSEGSSNPFTRNQQRERLKRRYIKEHRGQKSAGKTAKKASEYAEAAAEKAGEFAANHPHWIVFLALGFLLVYVANSLTGCAPVLQGSLDAITISTYPAEEADVRAAENVYLDMEKTLQDEIDHPAKYHPGCDEYYVTADKLWHDPYVLISLISAYGRGEAWTVDSAYPTIQMLFEWQYDKKVNIRSETRYTTVTMDGETSVVSYTVRICDLSVKNKNLSHAPMYIMDEEQVSLYSLYMATLGNMPDVFAGQPYASALKSPVKYDVPQELLDADPKFAALVKEANKYLGYPYVWGGHSPKTGFDCSGFIYWIFNNSGVASFGHQGAQGLYDSSRKVSPENARPGDVIFFSGTIEGESGITHCGLYVGNNHFIHCGNPCSYADLTDAYWQEHFSGYGRFY